MPHGRVAPLVRTPGSGRPLMDLTSTRVLVVDDDRALVRAVRLCLATEGFSVETAINGEEGLEMLRSMSFDAIVLDLQMPVMDGRTFYRAIRDRGFITPVVLLSAHGAQEARSELAAEAAINKPFDPDDLIAAVKRLVENTPVTNR
jgi:DNA-binding response OmpR family regulator